MERQLYLLQRQFFNLSCVAARDKIGEKDPLMSIPPSDGSSPPNPKSPLPPADKSNHAKQTSSSPEPEPHYSGGGMTDFMKLFTPEERKKFMNILIQNLTSAMQKEQKKAIEALKKQRQKIEGESDDS